MTTAVAKPRVRVTTDGMIRFGDGFANFLSGLGAGNPKVAANAYVMPWSQADLEAAYRTSTWFGKIVDIPADDATRGWRAWQAEDDQIELLEATEKRLQVRQKVREALIWSRLYGGAVIVPGGLPGSPSQPLPLDRIKSGQITFLTVLTRHEINAEGIIRDPLSPFYGQPERWVINAANGVQTYLHPSRVILVNGRKVPSRLGGDEIWGDSVWLHLQDAVGNADAGAAVIGALMQEAKVDVVRIPDLVQQMASAEAEVAYTRRWQMVAMLKSISNIMMLDGEDQWDQKQITWAGIPDVMMTLLTILAGAADIPVTRLIGTSAKGLNATGEGDIRNYYDNVKAKQELTLSPALAPLDEMLIRSSLGNRHPEVWYEWNPLWQPTEKEQAEIDKLEAETVDIYARTSLIPSDALAKSAANRMVESGRWPGLEQAIEESDQELGEMPDPADLETAGEGQEGDERRPDGQGQQHADAAPRTLYISRKVLNGAEIVAWAKGQGFETTLPADDLHDTVIHTRTPLDWIKVGQSGEWSSEDDGKMTIAPGGPRLMERFGDAVVLQFASSRLTWRHEDIKRMGAATDFPDYQPHVTISWNADGIDLDQVEPYQGRIVLGPEIFAEVNDDWRAGVVES